MTTTAPDRDTLSATQGLKQKSNGELKGSESGLQGQGLRGRLRIVF